MSQLTNKRSKKGIYTYISDSGQWQSTKPSNLEEAKFLQNKWDKQAFNSRSGRVDKEMSWSEFIQEDYELYAPPVHEEKSFIKLKQVVKVFEEIVRPVVVSAVTFKDAEKWLAGRSRQVEPRTVNAERSYLRPLFQRAKIRKYTDENPFEALKRIRVRHQEQKTLTVAEAQVFMDITLQREPGHELLALFMYETGMRADEMGHQRMEDVDFTGSFINANVHDKFCGCRECEKRAETGRPKGFGGKCNSLPRLIPISPRLQALLLQRFQQIKTGCIFPSESGIRQFADRTHERAGLAGRGVCVHTFRRTLASDMEEAGVRLSARKLILGHSQEKDDGVTGTYTITRKGDLHKEFQKVLTWREEARKRLNQGHVDMLEIISA